MDGLKPYDFIAQTYAVGGDIQVDPRCNAWTAINTGDTLVTVNGIPLKPFPPTHPELTGAAVAIPGNFEERFAGRIWILFNPTPGLNPQVCIIQKFYLKP